MVIPTAARLEPLYVTIKLNRFGEILSVRVALSLPQAQNACTGRGSKATRARQGICVQVKQAMRDVPKYRKKASNEPQWPWVKWDDIELAIRKELRAHDLRLADEAAREDWLAEEAARLAQPATTTDVLRQEHPSFG